MAPIKKNNQERGILRDFEPFGERSSFGGVSECKYVVLSKVYEGEKKNKRRFVGGVSGCVV